MVSLETYRAKRNFSATPEPEAKLVEATGEALRFIVQKHDATRLHYDFRLEWQGVLLSWAVTRGPSTDPREKRLAVRTEDHPLGYADFEGTIPKGNYGAGTVMLWDQGWWEPLHDPTKGLAEGKLHFRLHGARMKGGWALVRMQGKGRENWLLIKERDETAGRSADALINRHRRSVTSGRTLAEIARAAEAPKPRHDLPRPRFRKVQLATLRDDPPAGRDWLHEVKFDGYRCLIAIGKGGARLYTRNGKDWSDRFGALCEGAVALPCRSALIDGEVVAGEGGGSFAALQDALKTGGPLTFHAFDCLHLDGKDLVNEPQTVRRAALEKLLAGLPARGPIRLSPIVEGFGPEVLAAICATDGEGIVSKLADAPYRGERGAAWIKTKCQRHAEFVIAGWSETDKKSRPFSSLLLGSYEKGKLVYRGKVGAGFDEGGFEELTAAMAPLVRKASPFDEKLPPEARRGAHWIDPQLVAEVRYTEFTGEGRIRHGVFLGLREDKPAMTVSARTESEGETSVAGVRISSPDRLVYADRAMTKGDVAEYYGKVAERFLEHASGRPVSLLRCPDGADAECFFQKHAGKGFPDAVGSVEITEKSGETEAYMTLDSPAAILGAVQMGTLEFHIWGARKDRLERPDRMVFDLDPDEGLGFAKVRDAAQEVREALDALGLPSGAMVTGGKGVHVVVPLRRTAGWDTVTTFARTFAAVLAERYPARYVATMSKAKRKDRIFIDWLRNDRGSTAIAPYSLRARKGAPVAMPVTWEELAGLKSANAFGPDAAVERTKHPCPLAALSSEARAIGTTTVSALERWASDS